MFSFSRVAADRINLCKQVFRSVFARNPQVFGQNRHEIYYDLQSLLFTLSPLPVEPNQTLTLVVNQEDVQIPMPNRLTSVELQIRSVRENAQDFFLDDLNSLINPQTLKCDRSLMGFAEVALKQYASFNE